MPGFSSLSDSQLLELTESDPEAFGEFYIRHLPTVLRFTLSRLGDRELTADLAAEVFATALSARTGFDPRRGDARAWLCTIAAHKIIDASRRGRVDDAIRRRLKIPTLALEDDDLQRVEDLAAMGSAIESSTELLDQLPRASREAVAARILDEEPYDEIAARLECSESVVRQRVSRGLTRLRNHLQERA